MIISVKDKTLQMESGPFVVSDFPTSIAKVGDGWIVRVSDPAIGPGVEATLLGLIFETEEDADLAVQAMTVILGCKIKAVMTGLS